MPTHTDPRQLMEAFASFTKASERLQARYELLQHQLEQLQNEFQTVLEAIPFAIWVLGENGKLRFSNRPEGLPGAFSDGPPPWQVGSPNGLRKFKDLDGMEHFLEQESRSTKEGSIVILRNVTEQYMRAQHATREERLQAMGMMAAELAHEIRNPLGALSLYAGLLVEDLQENPGALEMSRKVQEAVQQLDLVVSNTLSFSRDLKPKLSPIPLWRFWEDAKTASGFPNGIVWHNQVPQSAQWHGDAEMLRQMAINLLQNAIRAMENSTTPKLSLIASEEMIGPKPHWHIALEDNGCGIPGETLTRIFDPFFSTFRGGTGLGLAVSHRIVTAHGGILHVESREGRGTTIRIRLPEGG